MKGTFNKTRGLCETTLEAARDAWKSAREPYLLTDVFRFYDCPIEELEGQIDAWPHDGAYIDYVVGDSSAGIINDPARTIDAATLLSLNEQGTSREPWDDRGLPNDGMGIVQSLFGR